MGIDRSRRIRRSVLCMLLLTASLVMFQPTRAQDYEDDYADFVKEVLEEDQESQQENEYYHEDSHYEQQKQQAEDAQKRKQAEEERIEQEKADRIAAERERAFQAELDRMSADQQKAALKQKTKDARIVRSVLRASQTNDLYKVLGIRNWNWQIPERTVRIARVSFTVPGVTIKTTTMKDIRRAYRNRAMAVHPDKNKDGRAQEAFIIVEESASILSDNYLREQYDKEFRSFRQAQRERMMAIAIVTLSSVRHTVVGILKAIRSILGPFATPAIILGLILA